MSERADLRLPCEHGRYEKHVGIREACPPRPATPAEVLSALLPDVDWEALRDHLQFSQSPVATQVARRLLAVYDGKDG